MPTPAIIAAIARKVPSSPPSLPHRDPTQTPIQAQAPSVTSSVAQPISRLTPEQKGWEQFGYFLGIMLLVASVLLVGLAIISGKSTPARGAER
jgi:hypothetical protein